MIALSISLAGVIYFLLACCAIVFLILGLRFLLGLAGMVVPPQMWGLLGFVLFLLLILYALGAFGGAGGISFR